MAAKLVVLCGLVALCAGVPVVPVHVQEAPAHYEFSYSVSDPHTGDVKQQQEAREGDVVHGSYSLIQPDGVRRVVHYSADEHSGFNAQVAYEGHPTEAPAKIAYAAPVHKVAYAAPVTKIAYAAPVAKVAYSSPISYAPVAKVAYSSPISYSAPIAKVAYSAPVAKVAYSAPLAHVSYSSPVYSYQH